MTTSDLYNAINDIICLAPSVRYCLKDYLRGLDDVILINDIKENEDEENEY